MAAENERLQRAEHDAHDARARVVAIESWVESINRNIGVLSEQITALRVPANRWLVITALTGVISGFAALAGVYVSYRQLSVARQTANTNQISMETRVDGIDRRMVALQTLVYTILRGNVSRIIDDALASATSGDGRATRQNLAAVSTTVGALRAERVPFDQELFTKAVSAFSQIEKTQAADPFDIKKSLESLAAYRSVAVIPGNLATIFAPGSTQGITAEDLAQLARVDGSTFKGFKVYRANYPMTEPAGPNGVNVYGDSRSILFYTPKGDAFIAPKPTRKARDQVSGILLVTESQTLDGFQWKDVVFANAHIVYNGGPVSLDHVAFVNCTFDTNSRRGTPVLNYALTGEGRVQIDGE